MGRLREGGRDLLVVATILAVLAALALTGAIGSAADRDGAPDKFRHSFASDRFGFSGGLPDGWSRSAERLVPLLLPKEILSVGTGPMPVGAGGECGRHPVAALARMRPGDVLVSIQEYAVTRRMRARLAEIYPPLDAYSDADQLGLRRYAGAHLGRPRAGSRVPAGRYWSATLPFRDDGRVFDALVYFGGQPSAARLAQVTSFFRRLDFRPGVHLGRSGPGPQARSRPAAPEPRLDLTYGPYLGVRCKRPNATHCDRVGIDVVLKERATQVAVSIAGQRILLRTPGLHNGVLGKDWVGDLTPAGLGRRGSPLYIDSTRRGHWAGDPAVYVPIRITARYADGTWRSATLPRVPLRPGWG